MTARMSPGKSDQRSQMEAVGCWWSQAVKGRTHYLHDADVVGAMQLTLLDHLLLESGKIPLQVFPLAGILLLQV